MIDITIVVSVAIAILIADAIKELIRHTWQYRTWKL